MSTLCAILSGVPPIFRNTIPCAALRFLAAAEAAFRRLAAMPGMGTRDDPEHSVLAEFRFFPITRFKNDLVFYRPLADGIKSCACYTVHRIFTASWQRNSASRKTTPTTRKRKRASQGLHNSPAKCRPTLGPSELGFSFHCGR